MKQGGTVSIDVYKLRGQKVRKLFCGILPKGEMTFAWDGKDDASRDAATGIYLIRAVIGRASRTIRQLKL